MITFPATDIEYALQAEIDKLKEQVKAYQKQNRELKEDLAAMIDREVARAAVGKEWGNNLDAYGQVVGGIGKITF
jgi:N12 class adenine-specific DNA methylase